MAYDVLIKNGRIIDGAAGQTVDVEGRVISPGFIDNHCHYDAQVTWDPLCSFSCDHGATSVVIGKCSLSLAPVRRGNTTRMAEFLSYVEAIPMEVLNTIEVDWETFPQYMERLDRNLGVNVGTLVGHTAVRYYVMGDECQKRTATDAELKQMQDVVRDSMEGGALGLSVSRNKGHYDPQGVHIPAWWADEKEIFALGDVLRPLCSPNTTTQIFNMSNTQAFRGSPTWHPILLKSDDEKLRAYADPAVRAKLHEEMVEWKVEIPGNTISREWYNYIWVEEPKLGKNQWMKGKTIHEVAKAQNKGIIDAFLDLVVEEKLETTFLQAENNIDVEAMRQILNFPNALIGLSDGGAHVQFHGGYGFSTRLLGEWVREKQVMSLENAVRRLTFDSASTFGLYDRGLLRPGMTADITIFDPDTVKPLPEYIVHDFPAGGWRFKEPAAGLYATFVNGQMLMKEGNHTGK